MAAKSSSTATAAPRQWIRLTSFSLALLCAYLVLVAWPSGFSMPSTCGGAAAAFLLVWWGLRWCHRQRPWRETRLQDVATFSVASLLSLLAIDTGYAIYGNLSAPPDSTTERQYELASIPESLEPEIAPRQYYPTGKNFLLYKPGVTHESLSTRGWFLPGQSIQHAELAGSSGVSYRIDGHGFRETSPMEGAGIFALGDSMTFGYHVGQRENWVDLLGQRIAQPVYNLGVSGSSPKQQVMLLEYLLQLPGAVFHPRHVLWMIYEGNDLVDSYEEKRPVRPDSRSLDRVLRGTLAGALASIPRTLINQSVLHRVLSGGIEWRDFAVKPIRDPYVLDGTRLSLPAYYSARFGYHFFQPLHLKLAAMKESDVLSHKNRPYLDRTFRRMRELSRSRGFEVTVLLTPSAERLYAEHFENFPPVSKEPHFLNYVDQLARQSGFRSVSLYSLLKPYTRDELLFFRDDPHWNARGNALVSELVARQVFESR